MKLLLVVLTVVAMCAAANAGTSYTNGTGGTVYQLDAPTSWAVIGGFPATQVLTGAGPNGGDAYYRVGAAPGDDSSQAFWDFSFADLPNVGHDLVTGQYAIQTYVSDYGSLPHENDGGLWHEEWPLGMERHGRFLFMERCGSSHTRLAEHRCLGRRVCLAVKDW